MAQKFSHTSPTGLEPCGEEGLVVAGFGVCARNGTVNFERNIQQLSKLDFSILE